MNRKPITSIATLKAACTAIHGGCWHWTGGMSRGRPMIWHKGIGHSIGAGLFIHLLLNRNKRPEPGTRYWRQCESMDCVRPEHWTTEPPARQHSAHQRAAVTAALRAKSKVSSEVIAEIRASQESGAEMARRHGLSRGYVSTIRRGIYRAPTPMPQASVFAMAAALAGA